MLQRFSKHLIPLAALLAPLVLPAGVHAQTIYDWTWSGGDSVVASGTLDVQNGYVISATGTISGGGLGVTGTLSLITANSPGVISNPDPANSTPGSFVFQDGNGDNFEGDTFFSASAPWVDYYGLVLAVSGTGLGTGNRGQSDYAFNIWSDGPSTWQASLGGNGGAPGQVDATNQYGTFTAVAVPEARSAWLLLCGLGGLALVVRQRKNGKDPAWSGV